MERKIGFIVVVVTIATLLGCSSPTPTPKTAPIPATVPAPATTPVTSTKAPEDVMPLAIPGFRLYEKEPYQSAFFGAEPIRHTVKYYAYSAFVPEVGSKFEGKVAYVQVIVYLFKSIGYCNDYYSNIDKSASKIQINGKEARLVDRDSLDGGTDSRLDYWQAWVYQQYGELLVISYSVSKRPDHPPPYTFDKPIVREGAVEGLRAIRF